MPGRSLCHWFILAGGLKPSFGIKALTKGFFSRFFLLKYWQRWLTLSWKWHETVGVFVKRCCVQKQQHSSLKLKKEVWKMKCGLFTNPAHSCENKPKKLYGQPCFSLPVIFNKYLSEFFFLPVFQKVWLLDVLQGTKSKHSILNLMEQRTNKMFVTSPL